MRRRNQLQVNTFPFLAVLLCAMGSLILILLVMDRRARMAALQRGQDEAGRAVRERAEAIAVRERERSHAQGEVKTAFDRKKAELKARLDAEQRALDGEMRLVQARLAEIARELRGEEELAGKLRANARTDQGRLTRHEQALEAARKEATDLGGKLANADRVRHKLAADTIQLEQIIRDLQAARKRDATTYSVVPYKGKHGEKRRPLYIECNASGLVFHPDKLTLTDPSLSSVEAEIARRAIRLAEQRKKAGLKEERAYLLILVRPDGINHYYQVQSAIHDLPVEFGFEFVDQDWTLSVPEGGGFDEATPAKESARLMAPGGPGGPVEGGVGVTGGVPGGVPGGGLATGSGPLPGGGSGVPGGLFGGNPGTGSGSLPSGGTDSPPALLGGPATGSGPSTGAAPDGTATPGATTGGNAAGVDASARLSRPQRSGEGPDLERGQPTGAGAKGPPSTGDAPPATGATNPPGETPLVRLPTVLPGSVAAGGTPGTTRGTPTAVAGGPRNPNAPAFQGPDLGPPKPRAFPLLPARVGGPEDTIVFVECLSDGVVVYPSGKSYSIDSLNHSPAHNPFYQSVAARLARHTGNPNRRGIRYLLHRDGVRTFHLAYPAFNALGVTQTRTDLQPGDDVSQIVAGE